ncbi:C-type lectin 37Da isoform X2 [Bacillus rossius redtenbacheri]
MTTITRFLSLAALLVAGASGDTIMTILLEGTQYYVSSMNPYQSELNYFLAYQHCRSLGLQLASFQTKDKAETIMQYLQSEGYDKDFWTSGNKLGKNMAIWMSTGQPFNATFSFMRTTAEPGLNLVNHYSDASNTTTGTSGRRIRMSSDHGHDLDSGCVALMAPTFQWDLDDCRVPKHYICEQSRCYYYNYASIPVSVTKG